MSVRGGTQPSGDLNVVLKGSSMTRDKYAVLNADNQYNVDLLIEEMLQVLQSNVTSTTDDRF